MSRGTFEWTRVQLLGTVIVGTVVTVTGDVEFALAPSLIQKTAVVVDVGLVTLQAVVLTTRTMRWIP